MSDKPEFDHPEQIHLTAFPTSFFEAVVFRLTRYWVDDDGKRRKAIGRIVWEEFTGSNFGSFEGGVSFTMHPDKLKNIVEDLSRAGLRTPDALIAPALKYIEKHLEDMRQLVFGKPKSEEQNG